MAAATVTIPAIVVLMVILLLNPTGCDDLLSFKPLHNNSTSGVGKYLVGDQDIESEFLMESYISRILANSENFETSSTSNANKAAGGDCGRPPRYDSCLGGKGNIPPSENCGTYNRENPC